MTYNFDPERWYDMQLAALEKRLADGELTPSAAADSRIRLEKEYNAMLDRLDGSVRISGADNIVEPPGPITSD